MLSELAQELYELGKKATAGDEDALVEFIMLYSNEYIEKLSNAGLTKDESNILLIIHTGIDICELQARTPDELYEEDCYTIYDVLEELKTWKVIDKLEELDKIQVIE